MENAVPMENVSMKPLNLFHPTVAFHIETSQLICNVFQLIGFYLIATLALHGLMKFTFFPLDYPK